MQDLKCPFALPLLAQDAKCSKGTVVARRAGPDISCHNADCNQRCRNVHEGLLRVTLVAQDMEYDLTIIPHSLLAKIQYGGLQALAEDRQTNKILDDVSQLVQDVVQQYGVESQVPYERYKDTIADYKIKRRGRSRDSNGK